MTDFTLVPRNDGTQLMSDPTGAETPDVVAPVTSFWASGQNTSSISLSWSTESGQAIDDFTVKISLDGITYDPANWVTKAADQRTHTYVSLSAGTTYYFQIVVNHDGGTSAPMTINHNTDAVEVPPPGGGEGDGKGVLMNLGYSSIDTDENQPSYIRSAEVWADAQGAQSTFETFEAPGKYEWVYNPSQFTPHERSRTIRFNQNAWIFFDIPSMEGATSGYLTIRYKDDAQQSIENPRLKIWSINYGGNIGEITLTYDHAWKIVQFPVDFTRLEVRNNRYCILVGDAYDKAICGDLPLDMVKLSPTQNYDEFKPATSGYFPVIAPENQRFNNLGETNEWVPGEGAFFPYGAYIGLQQQVGNDWSADGSPSADADDEFNIWADSGFNAMVHHDFNDINLDLVIGRPDHAFAGLTDLETGFAEKLKQARTRNIKLCHNPLGRTRKYWILNEYASLEEVMATHTADAQRFAGDNMVLAWMPVDEMDHNGVDYNKPQIYHKVLQKLYADADPNTPVIASSMGFPLRISAQAARESNNAIGNDNYCVDATGGADTLTGLRQYSRLSDYYYVLKETRAYYAIPYMSTSSTHDGVRSIWWGEYRSPNVEEMKWQAWYCFAADVDGILWWDPKHPRFEELAADKPWFAGLGLTWDGAKEVGRRLFNSTDGVSAALLAPWTVVDMSRVRYWNQDGGRPQESWFTIDTHHGVVTVSNDRVVFALKENGANRVMFAANMTEGPVTVTFTIPGMSDGVKESRFEGSNVTASGGSFTDTIEFLGTRTYIIEGSL